MIRLDNGSDAPACDSCTRRTENLIRVGSWRICERCYDRDYGTANTDRNVTGGRR